VKRVGFWLRAVALLIDVVITTLFSAICTVALGLSDHGELIFLLAMGLVLSSLDFFIRASLGKIILKLYIARADGTPADRWTLLLRWSTIQLPIIALLLYTVTDAPGFYLLYGFSSLIVFIGCLFAVNDSKQAWHDQWAKTAVFRRSKKTAAPMEVVAVRE
jgi:uncharacterized RDD family membrane protein YckC